MKVSTSLSPADCAILGRQGIWDKVPSCNDEWVFKQLQRHETVPLGPYVLALSHEDESLSLIHSREFLKQRIQGADMESLGTILIGSKAQAEWFAKARKLGEEG